MSLKIAARIQALTGVALVGLLLILGLSAYDLAGAVTSGRSLKTKDLVDAAHSLLVHFESEERAGRMTRDSAQKTAAAAIGALRYGNGEFFWINDMQSRLVAHADAKLVGRDVSGLAEPSGRKFFAAMMRKVEADGAAFETYTWTRPGSDVPVEKVSYARSFRPWGWVVGSGIYADDTAVQVHGWLKNLFVGAGLVALLVAAAATLIGRSIARPLVGLSGSMAALAAGRLDETVPATARRDEIGAMARPCRCSRRACCGPAPWSRRRLWPAPRPRSSAAPGCARWPMPSRRRSAASSAGSRPRPPSCRPRRRP